MLRKFLGSVLMIITIGMLLTSCGTHKILQITCPSGDFDWYKTSTSETSADFTVNCK